MKKPNFSQLIKEELVKRFENVVKNEHNAFQNIQSEIFNRLSLLENKTSLFESELSNVINENYISYKDALNTLDQERNRLSNEFEEQRKFIRINSNEIKQHIKESKQRIDESASNDKLDRVHRNLQNQINDAKVDFDDEIKMVVSLITESIIGAAADFESKIKEKECQLKVIESNLTEFRKKLDEYLLNNEGYLKEIKALNRTVFVQSKEIEHIYTLLERAGIKK
jgi:hypothetical protein